MEEIGGMEEKSVELPTSGPVRITVTSFKPCMDTEGEEYMEDAGGREEKEESVELPTSGPVRITVTCVRSGPATGGVHEKEAIEEQEAGTGRRRRRSVKELVEKIEKGVASETSSRDRWMSNRKKKFEQIEVAE